LPLKMGKSMALKMIKADDIVSLLSWHFWSSTSGKTEKRNFLSDIIDLSISQVFPSFSDGITPFRAKALVYCFDRLNALANSSAVRYCCLSSIGKLYGSTDKMSKLIIYR